MDATNPTSNENIREIEDIINIQKANGNLNVRQVAFNVPEEQAAAGLARSLESGLTRQVRARRRCGKRRARWRRGAAPDHPDAVSWPSDSDVTVLRVRAARGGGGGGAGAGAARSEVAGDGLHRPDGCSMVNLATLVLPAPSASKPSLAQELLLPLSSWERREPPPCVVPGAGGGAGGEWSTKARLARFLRLYFCPCCTCLYEMERGARDEPSLYLAASSYS